MNHLVSYLAVKLVKTNYTREYLYISLIISGVENVNFSQIFGKIIS